MLTNKELIEQAGKKAGTQVRLARWLGYRDGAGLANMKKDQGMPVPVRLLLEAYLEGSFLFPEEREARRLKLRWIAENLEEEYLRRIRTMVKQERWRPLDAVGKLLLALSFNRTSRNGGDG